MKSLVLDEPDLEFGGGGKHVDPRFGICEFGPADLGTEIAPSAIRVGVIGPADGIEGVTSWLERCRDEISGKPQSRFPSLFRDFPGFDTDRTYRSRLVFDDSLVDTLSRRSLSRATSRPGGLGVADCVDLYAASVERFSSKRRCDVVLCARPADLEEDRPAPPSDEEAPESILVEDNDRQVDFHDLLKARCLPSRLPIQLVRPTTWGGKRPRRTVKMSAGVEPIQLQDEATRAWNIHTALYYKAGGVPWRLPRASSDYASLFVGVSFFNTTSRDSVHTSVAHVFNERGEGVVVRGGPAVRRKEDRQPHLDEAGARDLLLVALAAYRAEHHTLPARLVLHKTSDFDDAEVRGLTEAADEENLEHLELIWIQSKSAVRAFRFGDNAVLRGTLIQFGVDRHVLFSRGSVDFYGLYPGMYIPAPITLRIAMNEHDPRYLAEEVLRLTKLNWNQSQLDGRLPITLRASQRVAGIMKHIAPDEDLVARYAQFI